MGYFDRIERDGAAGAEDFESDRAMAKEDTLTGAAHRSLEQIADALGVTTALLSHNPASVKARGADVSLLEAIELLQAFIRIDDPEARQRCLAFVKEAATLSVG
ncbi:hypothetical protein U8607_21940 [Methylobacterium durans]|uniref:hypothetical protein n=1 Tax=Methylobacterium durans TaxID=2202825 RepID=UPI002AFE8797|nr:hypothetical protein [Methylobacterium durans]MEA1834760.1 hypothetical protein [Methylobacterium durans]